MVFIHNLREMSQHYRLPIIGATWELINNELKLFLNKGQLLTYKGWKVPAKEFLKSQTNQVDLTGSLEEYHERIHEFHNWVRKNYHLHHISELRIIEEYHENINKAKVDMIVWELEEALKSEMKARLHNIRFALSGTLPNKEMISLANYETNLKVWIRKALGLIQRKIDLPGDLVKQILENCK